MGNKASQPEEDSTVSRSSNSSNSSNSQRNTSARAAGASTRPAESASNNAPASSNNNEDESPSYWQQLKDGYQQLVHAIIRPPRCNYRLSMLGPETFTFCGANFFRRDFELRNNRGLRLMCSMWLPVASERKSTALPCVIYMHGNSSGRVEAIGQLATVLSIGATMVAFDFCGSGLSEGEYVSLGFFEREDLQTVVEHIRDAGGTSLIALWGRSMGAATALLHGGRDPSMACMVLDSSFTDLSHLAEELVERGRRNGLFAPSFAVWIALRAIRSSVLSTAGFDIKDISPISVADHCFIPALFIAAESDAFIGPHHSQRLCEVYSGDKNIILVKGDHNSVRPLFLFDSVSIFLINALRIPEEWLLPGMSSAYVGRSPWGRPAAPQFSKTLSSVAASSTSSLKSRDRKPNSLSPTTTSAVSTEAVASSSGSSLSAQELQEESDRAVAWQLMQEEIELMDRSQQGKERQKRTAVASQKEDDAKQTDLQEEDFEEMDVGMTRARQDEVNAAICGVFGGTVTKAGTSANSESGSTESSNTGKKT